MFDNSKIRKRGNKMKNIAMKNIALFVGIVLFSSGVYAEAREMGCVRQIAEGYATDCAVGCDGTVKCWHIVYGNDGFVGLDEAIDIEGLGGVVQVSVGSYLVCALTETSQVYCWSYSKSENFVDESRLHDSCSEGYRNDNEDAPAIRMSLDSRPVRVPELDGTIQLSATYGSQCALSASGKVRCWGNIAGRDGDFFFPRLIPELGGARKIAAGFGAVCAILDEAGVRCWTFSGGDENIADHHPMAVDVLDRASDLNVSHAFFHAVRPDGTVARWGMRSLYALRSESVPSWLGYYNVGEDPIVVSIPGVSDALTLTGGMNPAACAMRRDGASCWGWLLNRDAPDGTWKEEMEPNENSFSWFHLGVQCAYAIRSKDSAGYVSCDERGWRKI